MARESLYEILGVSSDASELEIQAAYRSLVQKVHPDVGGSDALFRVVRHAYEVLSDPARRKRYDASDDTDDFYVGDEAGARSGSGEAGFDAGGPNTSFADDAFNDDFVDDEYGPEAADAPSGTSHRATRLIARYPSFALTGSGVAVMLFGSSLHASALVFLGFIGLALGISGIVGRRAVARVETLRRAGMYEIDTMSGQQFEYRLVQMFRMLGYSVLHVGRRGDYGADLVLDDGGPRTVVQAKRSSYPVGLDAVREVAAARAHYGADDAMVVTNAIFTVGAMNLADSNQVRLWDRTTLATMISEHSRTPGRSGSNLLRAELREGVPVTARWVGAAITVVLAAVFGVIAGLAGSAASTRRARR